MHSFLTTLQICGKCLLHEDSFCFTANGRYVMCTQGKKLSRRGGGSPIDCPATEASVRSMTVQVAVKPQLTELPSYGKYILQTHTYMRTHTLEKMF